MLRVSTSAQWPRPYIGVCGSMHGNEPCGALAIQRIARELEAGSLIPTSGTIFLIHANPKATALGVRHTPDSEDLNRLWDFQFERRLRPEVWGYEHHRVLELRHTLGNLDLFLDLHSAKAPTPAFGVSNGEAGIDDIARRIGISYLVQSWYGLADKVIIGFLKLSGIPALSVECGSHDDPEIAEKAYGIAMAFLRTTGAIHDGKSTEAGDVQTVHVLETITKPSEDFRFDHPWTGFQELQAGTRVGCDRVTEIRASRPCYVVLPNEEVETGDDVLYLAVKT